MASRILYEFDDFLLDPSRNVLRRGGATIELGAKPFKLLLTLVEKSDQSFTKEDLMAIVWPGVVVTDDNFHVTLNAVRKVLGESGRNPRLIVRSDDGYKLVAYVTTAEDLSVSSSTSDSAIKKKATPRKYLSHIIVSSALYAALYALSVTLEIAFKFDRFGSGALRILPLTFGWVMITSAAGLMADHKLVLQDKTGGIGTTILIFFVAALILFLGLTILPDYPVTRASFQTYPAQAAYLKNIVYYLALSLLFMIVPFHFVIVMQREIWKGHAQSVLDILTLKGEAVLPKGAIYLKFAHLALVLLVFAVLSIIMAGHLLDNLESGAYQNLFTQLVYLRGILYFGLGLECLIWYYSALSDLNRECRMRGEIKEAIQADN